MNYQEQSSGGVEEMNQSPEDWDTTWSEDSTCQSLRTKKQQLEKAKARQEMQQQQIQVKLF